MTNHLKEKSAPMCGAALLQCHYLIAFFGLQRKGLFSGDNCSCFPSPVEGNCWVWFCFVFNAALYNEKVGVNERKRKRRTTIR